MDYRCTGCNATLRVDNDVQGGHARCPHCGTVQRVGGAAAAPSEAPAPRNPNDPNAGLIPNQPPVKLSSDEPQGTPSLSEVEASQTQPGEGVANTLGREPDPTPHLTANYRREFHESNWQRHRGGLVLTLSLLGLLCTCPVLSITAWVVGSRDLRKMACGDMDPAGQDSTRAGYYIGMAASFLWIALSVCISIVLFIRSGA